MSRWWFLRIDHISYFSLPQMRKTLLLSPLILIFLAACSPQAYQVNPQPDVSTKPNEIPESQQEDYMRIIGDLRWDKLTSQKDWEKRFPGCLTQAEYFSARGGNIYPEDLVAIGSFGSKNFRENYDKSPNPKCDFSMGGIQFSLLKVLLEKDSTGKRSTRTKYVHYLIPRGDQERAFNAAIQGKYTNTIELKNPYGSDSATGNCSKYSCFINPYHQIRPTPYTTSILDSVKVDPSAF